MSDDDIEVWELVKLAWRNDSPVVTPSQTAEWAVLTLAQARTIVDEFHKDCCSQAKKEELLDAEEGRR